MSRGTFSTTNYFHTGFDSISLVNIPLTISCWGYVPAWGGSGTLRVLVGIFKATTTDDGFAALMTYDASTDRLYAYQRNNTAASGSEFSYGTANTWFHVAGTFISSTSRKVYVNGTVGESDTGGVSAMTCNDICIGVGFADSAALYNQTQSYVSQAAIWNVALSAAEITSLSKGLSPLMIRPESLQHYFPLTRGDSNGDEIDIVGGLVATETGTVPVNANPRIYFPV